MKYALCVLKILTLSMIFWGQECTKAASSIYNPKFYKLANGLELIVIENHRAPLVIHMMGIKVGTNDSPWGKSGLAHYLEHLMFKGRPESAAGRIMREVNRLGGSLNAQTSADYTIYHETVHVKDLETILKLDAERLAKLEIDDSWAHPELQVILEERYMRVDNAVMGKFHEALNALDTRHHPSRLPVIGWAHEIKDYTSQDARTFYQNWYAPNNAFILIGGDITFEDAKKLVEKYYGAIPARPLPARLNLQEPKKEMMTQSVEMASEIVKNPLYVRRYEAPTYHEGGRDKFYPLIILEDLLGRAITGRLTRALVEQQHLATEVNVSYRGFQAGPGNFQITMTPTDTITLEILEKALTVEIEKLRQEGVLPQEVMDAKEHILASLVYVQDDLLEGAETVASLYALGGTLADIEAWPDYIQAVTPLQVNQVLQEMLQNPPRIIGRLMPKKMYTAGAAQ